MNRRNDPAKRMWRAVTWSAYSAILVVAFCLSIASAPAHADSGPKGQTVTPGSHLPTTSVQTKVDSRPDGVYIEIHVRQDSPDGHSSAPHVAKAQPSLPKSTGSQTVDASANANVAPSAPSTPDRTWTDETGIYQQTPDGHVYYVTVPNISSQGDMADQLRNHPNETPYTLYVDNKFQGIIWIPNNTPINNVHLGTPPAQLAIPPNPPAGNGSSTDPYQVALDLLDHVPLPNILIKMNPDLGLVHLPGWFWVDGYDGKPFGMSRTVTIPPEVGPNVPVAQVPANDPRRQGTSFTVSVRVWPTNYQWNFGDGATVVTDSLGKPYPNESDIKHTYDFSSFHFKDGFPVQLTVVFNAEFQVDGGGPQGLPPMAHTYASNYRVQEAQAILTAH